MREIIDDHRDKLNTFFWEIMALYEIIDDHRDQIKNIFGRPRLCKRLLTIIEIKLKTYLGDRGYERYH